MSKPKEVAEELKLHEQLKASVKKLATLQRATPRANLADGLEDLREQAQDAHVRDLPSLLDQLHTRHRLASRNTDIKLPDMRAPYFAHIQIEENGKTRDLLIGNQSYIEDDIAIIDWRAAPLAKIFFNYREGDSFEIELPNRLAQGKLICRRMINFDKGEIIQVYSGQEIFTKNAAGDWESRNQDYQILSGGEKSATRKASVLGGNRAKKLKLDIEALLDKTQYNIITEEDDRPLLILGGAGSGKTTVAIHRAASLHQQNPKQYPQHKMLVIVPEPGLAKLSKILLRDLGLNRVRIFTFEEWAANQGQHLMPSLPKKICEHTPAKVISLKRHKAMTAAFPLLAKARLEKIVRQINRVTNLNFDQVPSASLFDQVAFLRKSCEQAKPSHNWERIFQKIKADIFDLNFDRFELFTNERLINAVIEASDGDLQRSHLDLLKRHSLKQITTYAGRDYEGIEAEHLTTLDQRDLRDEVDELGGTIDIEDYPVLLLLLEYYSGKIATARSSLHTYAHIIIDEAQELSELELELIKHAEAKASNLTIAGDAVQQTDPNLNFCGWETLLSRLDAEDAKTHVLETSYRCPEPINRFAHHVLGPIAPKKPPKSVKTGPEVRCENFATEGLLFTQITAALEDLRELEPESSVAIVTRDEPDARHFYSLLSEHVAVRLVTKGDFSFAPGVDVTDVSQVKGLEFDYIIIPDANVNNYPNTDEARRALHVAATRAMHQLWILTVGTASPLVD